MTKQAEIREHLIELFEQTPSDEVADNLADAVLWVLNEDGVVIKTGDSRRGTLEVEPLIEELKS